MIARNRQYWGDYSVELPILAAQEPSKPDAPTTELVGYYVKVAWVEPFNGGSPVTGYRIFLRKSDQTSFAIDFSYCDGSQNDIFLAMQCLVPSSSFISQLYGYQWG